MIRRLPGAALAALCLASPVRAQDPPLAFLGFRAGVPLTSTDAQVRLLLGSGLTCQRSQADLRLQDCRATLIDPVSNAPATIWLAAIDSTTGVVTVSARLRVADFERWRIAIEATYGGRAATMQGNQGMVQWVRGTQMLRLTWRAGATGIEASVSLVDGPVLESWTLGDTDSARIAKPRAPG